MKTLAYYEEVAVAVAEEEVVSAEEVTAVDRTGVDPEDQVMVQAVVHSFLIGSTRREAV